MSHMFLNQFGVHKDWLKRHLEQLKLFVTLLGVKHTPLLNSDTESGVVAAIFMLELLPLLQAKFPNLFTQYPELSKLSGEMRTIQQHLMDIDPQLISRTPDTPDKVADRVREILTEFQKTGISNIRFDSSGVTDAQAKMLLEIFNEAREELISAVQALRRATIDYSPPAPTSSAPQYGS